MGARREPRVYPPCRGRATDGRYTPHGLSDRDYLRYDYPGEGPRNRFWATLPGTKALMIGIGGIWVLMMFLKAISPEVVEATYRLFSLVPHKVLRDFWLWQLVTCGLLHSLDDLFHIFFNVLMLYFFGRMIEQQLGLKRYLLFCLGALVTASMAFLFWGLQTRVAPQMVGFSGAIMGLMALAALWAPNMRVLLFGVFPMKLWVLVVALIVLDLLMMVNSSGGVAHAAHLGGALYGYVYFKYGGRFRRAFNALERRAEAKQRKRERMSQHKEQEMREELDRILDKVNREGMPALSDQEKRFLKSASDRLRP